VIFCGDLNATAASPVYRRLDAHLRDAQLLLDNHRPLRTFFSRWPINRIDHVFVSPSLRVVAVEVPRSQLIATASDHLPLIIEVQLE
jgi:endonuclease/exonuclease/phosphatase family metal-dependent hydrolase